MEEKNFSNHYLIFENGQQVGELIDKPFSSTTTAKLNGRQYTFKTTGFFKMKTEIIDSSNKVVGQIDYGSWMKKATISTKESVSTLKFDNSWNTKWSIKMKIELKFYTRVRGQKIRLNRTYMTQYFC